MAKVSVNLQLSIDPSLYQKDQDGNPLPGTIEQLVAYHLIEAARQYHLNHNLRLKENNNLPNNHKHTALKENFHHVLMLEQALQSIHVSHIK